jgi:predicted SnoaL-like aldol condensation-catalyzing enzyme/predicted ester cyclase
MRETTQEKNKARLLEGFDLLFNQRNYEAAKQYWSPKYIQHSAHIPPGREGLFNLVKGLPLEMKYESGMIIAEADYVMAHGRYTRPDGPNWVVVDVMRIKDGIFEEHWDVIQDEATKEQSKSGLPMFGTSFAKLARQAAPATTASPLTVEQARAIVAPLYDALNQPAKKDVNALLAKAANPDYKSFHTNEEWLNREQLADVFKMIGSAIPDLRWTIEDIQTFGDQIIVRGEATGTPTGELFGAKPTGKSFKTMAIDIFTVKNGKLASAYHVENWMTALQQISK